MKNRVFVYGESQNIISKYSEKLEKFLYLKGLFDFSFLQTTDFEQFEESLKTERENGSTYIIICENDKLDKCLEIIKTDGDELSLVDEQAIKSENAATMTKMLFVPLELGFEKFLDEFLQSQNCFVYSVFGKSLSFVKERFESFKNEFGCDYKIITKHQFLHTVFCSLQIDRARIFTEFGENVFAEKDVTLAETLKESLRVAGKTLTSVEFGTNGKLSSMLDCDGIVLRGSEQLKEAEISQEMQEGENAGKEIVFALSKYGLAKKESDFVLSVCDRAQQSERSYVSVGDSQTVHLYSSIFSDEKDERIDVLCDFAIFRMICFVKSQNS